MDKFTRRTTTLSDSDFSQAVSSETQAPIEGTEGHGCPTDWYRCDRDCRAMGYRGGYCDSFFNLRCHCF